MKIGFPRALWYHYKFTLWKTFLEGVGLSIVVSGKTTKPVMEEGVKITNSELCLPVKVFQGHCVSVLNQGVDALFVPRIICEQKEPTPRFSCPKFIGLPDAVRATFDEEITVISPVIDERRENWKDTLVRTGMEFVKDKDRVRRALHEAVLAQEQAEAKFFEKKSVQKRENNIRIGVVGHAYVLFDSLLNLNLLKKLRDLGAEVLTSYNIPKRDLEHSLSKFHEISWTYERELVGACSYFRNHGQFDGVILVLSFACGPGCIMKEIIEREEKDNRIPLLTLVIDEHTGEAGFMTRLESFVDMIRMRKAKKVMG